MALSRKASSAITPRPLTGNLAEETNGDTTGDFLNFQSMNMPRAVMSVLFAPPVIRHCTEACLLPHLPEDQLLRHWCEFAIQSEILTINFQKIAIPDVLPNQCCFYQPFPRFD